MSAVLVIGDPDTHGGNVASGDSRTTVACIPVALLGSSVTPDGLPGHSGKVIVGVAASGRTTAGGIPVAASGAPVNCGANVTATHSSTTLA